ncbi:hypothetical protein MUK42_23830 [Musa troglodytarum]|uniref:Membrane-associated kinase regulator 2 n=1 Tax=Musa troglodytarum TaxID=320322 RepID=A0A9E7G7E3_9LILI|nr:hypothetical protein MUK42_23830 [Musa troglodytarum]
MESFTLLKYWRGGGGGGGGSTVAETLRACSATPVVATAFLHPSSATTDDGGDNDDDEGPFFDLEFPALTVDNEVEEGEFNFELSSVGHGGGGNGGGGGDDIRSEGFSPTEDLFFKGKLVPLGPSSIVIAASESDNKPQFPATSILRSATKFRVFLLGLRKPKPTAAEPNAAAVAAASSRQQLQQHQSRFFVKFKVEELPIISLFTRDSSSRNSSANGAVKPQAEDTAVAVTTAEEKRLAREVIQKYVNMIKPLYVRASRKHGEKPMLPGEPAPGEGEVEVEPEETAPAPAASAGGLKGLPAGLRVVGKRLGNIRSASATVAAVPPPPPPQRRDDTLLEQQDAIQSAIAHCKRSFTAPEKGSQSPLARSKSDPIRATGDQI